MGAETISSSAIGVDGTNILSKIVGSTTSELVMVAVIFAVVIILVGLPIYRMMTKSEEYRRQQYIDRETKLVETLEKSADKRETQLIRVIERNSEVMTELKTLFTMSNDKYDLSRREQQEQYKELKKIQQEGNKMLHDISKKLDEGR